MNASRLPSGEYSGRDSSAGCDTSRCASPPLAGATQMSPPETKAISGRVGHSAGWVKYGTPAASAAAAVSKEHRKIRMYQMLTGFLVGWLGMKLLMVLFAAAAFAQETAAPPPVELTPAEKQFQDSMVNVKLVGHYTLGDERRSCMTTPTPSCASPKSSEDSWKFEARIQYNKKDVPIAMNLPVKFAGDTPVISSRTSGSRASDRSPRAW